MAAAIAGAATKPAPDCRPFMKITIGSVDGLGDFVLRLPLFEALLAAGHRLQLVMRPPAADLARELFPETEVLVLERDPFRAETKKQRSPFRHELAGIRKFGPDLYVASAFQLNFFDEVFAREITEVRMAGFTCDEDFWPSDTAIDPYELAGRFDVRASVPTNLPEGRKNLRLAEALTGVAPTRVAPRRPTADSLHKARELLAAHGLSGGDFTVVCAGSRPGLVMKDWGEAHWASLLGRIGADAERSFVFVGNPKEAASVSRLCESLPPRVRRVNLAAEPPPVAVSYALVSLASAYLGRDSGVMHLAAAAGVPLLAVFAGGHWPRFLPEAQRGIILTREAPCRGCNFYCPFPEPWCVKTVPVDAVARAWRDLPQMNGLQTVELPAGEQWLSMARDLDVPSYAREQAESARLAVHELENESLWRKLVSGLTSR
jgi:ADP-heptose:LPS heptosyltransferase